VNIYKITNLSNNLIYVGQEKNYNPRYYGSGILIKKAISEFGIENFKKKTIESSHREKINGRTQKEDSWGIGGQDSR